MSPDSMRRRRLALGWTQDYLAEKLGHQGKNKRITICQYESGYRKLGPRITKKLWQVFREEKPLSKTN